MPSLRPLKLPFEPPTPTKPTVAETATLIVAGVGVMAVLIAIHPVLVLAKLAVLPFWLFRDRSEPEPPFDVERALIVSGAADTRTPTRDEHGDVECTRCSAFVPYASMSLNEEGCFCRYCATATTQRALAAQHDETPRL